MSTEQLEKQIQLATLALEKASKSSNKKPKKEISKEMEMLKIVLEQSKKRLKEIEAAQKEGLRDIEAAQKRGSKVPPRKQINKLEMIAEEMVAKEPADPNEIKKVNEASSFSCMQGSMPWMITKSKTMPEKEAPKEDRDDKEEGGGLLSFSFGMLPSVSSLGSQLFGKSETKRLIKKQAKSVKIQENQDSIQDALRRNEEATRVQEDDAKRRNEVASRMEALNRLKQLAEEECRDQPIESSPSESRDQPVQMKRSSSDRSWGDRSRNSVSLSFSRSRTGPSRSESNTARPESPETEPSSMLSADDIAEQELKAREKYIAAQKVHQDLRRKGLSEDSPLVRASAKKLRDCYADIEYWECLGEEAANRGTKKSGGLQGKFRGRDPYARGTVDVDQEATKARDAYMHAMKRHQELVPKRVPTSSKEWIDSQNRVNDALSNLQYWEGRSQFLSVPPTIC